MSNTNQKKPTNNIDEIDVVELLLQLLRKWYVFVIFGFICVLLAIIAILRTTPEYYTESSVLIKQENNMANGFANFEIAGISSSDLLGASKAIEDELIIFKSKNIMTEMVSNLGLQTEISYRKEFGIYYDAYAKEPLIVICPDNYYATIKGSMSIDVKKKKDGSWKFKFTNKHKFKKTRETHLINSLNQTITTQWGDFRFIEIPENIDPKYPNYKIHYNIVSLKSRVSQYIQNIDISLANKKSNTIKVSTTGDNQEKNELVINKIVDLYNNDAISDKTEESMILSDFLKKRIELLVKELDTIETSVEQYRRHNNIANVEEQSKLIISTSNDYNKHITSLDIRYNTLSFIEEYINKSDSLALIPSNASTGDETLASMIVNYNNQIIEYLRLSRSTNKENPFVVQLKTKITLNRQNILQTLKNVKKSILMQKTEIERQNNTLLGEIQNIPTIEREYIEVAREQGVKRKLYLYLLQRLEETQLALASTDSSNKIIDRAYTDVEPVSPNKKLILILAIFLSGIISLLYIYAKSLFNNKIESKAMLTSLTKQTILSVIPSNKTDNSIVFPGQSPTTEMIRLLRSRIKTATKELGHNIILVTSTTSGEGKSFISSNLAVALSMTDKKVVIVDLNIHKPALAKYLKINNQFGITTYLSENGNSIEDLIKPTKYENLDICLSGSAIPNASELLNTSRFEELIQELSKRYDYVIIDSASIDLTGDTFIIGTMADLTLYICRYKTTRKEHIEKLNKIAGENHLKNIFIILNDVPEQQI